MVEIMFRRIPKSIGGDAILNYRARSSENTSAASVFERDLIVVAISHVTGSKLILQDASPEHIKVWQIETPDDRIDLSIAHFYCFVMLQEVTVLWRNRIQRSRSICIGIIEHDQEWEIPIFEPGVGHGDWNTVILDGCLHALAGVDLPPGAIPFGL